MLTNTDNLRFEVYDESELSWKQHNQIHEALNIAYGHRTGSFLKKTYSHYPPIKRILCFIDGKLVGHTAIFEAHLLSGSDKVLFGGVGMTLSLKPFLNLAYQLRKHAAAICAELGYPFAIGRVKNSKRIKNNLSSLVSHFLDIPMLGTTSKSHSWETLAIYSTQYDKQFVDSIIEQCINEECVKVDGEVF